MRFSTRQFSGERPKLEPRNLQDNEAQVAINCELTSTGLRALFANKFIQKLTRAAMTIYNLDGHWLSWSERVSVAETPTGISTRRVFWTGDGVPKQATFEEFIQGRQTRMGVPTPAAPRISIVYGVVDEESAIEISTFYTMSFVNRYGEEGDMSLPSRVVTYRQGQIIQLNQLDSDPDNIELLEQYDSIVAYRLYMLSEGESRFVTEQPLGVGFYEYDSAEDVLGEAFATQDFIPPPDDLQGLHIMANGVAVGFVGKTVHLSEPYNLNAWPYSFPVQSDVVGVSSFDNTLVIGTTGYPEVATIYDPQAVSPSTLTEREPCVSQFSMVQGLGGVMYAAPSGLFYIGASGGQSLTNAYMDDRDWQALSPETMHAVYRDGEYYGFHQGDVPGCWIFDSRESNALIRRLSDYSDAAHVRQGTDDLYLVSGQQMFLFQGDKNYRLTYLWTSKEHGPGNPIAMTSARVLSHDYLDRLREAEVELSVAAHAQGVATNAANFSARIGLNPVNGLGGAINQDVIGGAGFWQVPGITDPLVGAQPLGAAINNGSDVLPRKLQQLLTLTVRTFADKTLVDTAVVDDEEPFRLSYSDRARRWHYELIGELDVSQHDMAGSISELHYGS